MSIFVTAPKAFLHTSHMRASVHMARSAEQNDYVAFIHIILNLPTSQFPFGHSLSSLMSVERIHSPFCHYPKSYQPPLFNIQNFSSSHIFCSLISSSYTSFLHLFLSHLSKDHLSSFNISVPTSSQHQHNLSFYTVHLQETILSSYIQHNVLHVQPVRRS